MDDGPLRIVIIDDSPEDRAELKSALLRGSTRRYELHDAETGEEGLALVQRLGEAGSPPDCILLDFNLPGMNAFEVLAALPREEDQIATPVVVVTGMQRIEESRALITAGAQDFIGKGWLTPEGLTRAVEHALERHALTLSLQRSMLATITDITEKQSLERKLQQAQKLESLGVLAGGIAHDFNNLLVGVLGNAELALADLAGDSPVRPELESIRTAAIRASELTKQLLAYAGQGRFVITRFDLGKLVAEMGSLLAAAIPKDVHIDYHLAPSLPAIEGDPTQLRQVVMNLITNAADAICDKKTGGITVRTSAVNAAREDLDDTLLNDKLAPGSYVCLEVSDTGCGMTKETRAKIFDPFFSTKFTGRGLGLAATLGILRAHKGAIKLRTEPGRGSTFTILLPAVEGKPDEIRATHDATGAWHGAGTILVVEDEETVRKVMRRILERAGFRVLVAVDGLAALEIYKKHRAEIRAVVLDLTMPRMDGEEAFCQLRQIDPGVRILLSSGYSEQETTSRFMGKGLAGFVAKPFKPQTLLDRLREVLARDE